MDQDSWSHFGRLWTMAWSPVSWSLAWGDWGREYWPGVRGRARSPWEGSFELVGLCIKLPC